MATEEVKLLKKENRAQVVSPKGTVFEETQVAYEPTPVAEGDFRNVPGDWKTAKGSSRETLTEIREKQAEAYRKTREKGKSTVRENVTVELAFGLFEQKKEKNEEENIEEKRVEPVKRAEKKK